MRTIMLAAALLAGAAAVGQNAPAGDGGSEYFPVGKGDVLLIVGDSIGGPQHIIPMIRKAYPKLDLWGINASIGGNTLRDAVGRMERDVIRTDLGTEGIDWVVVMFGANDSGVMDAKTYESYYRKLIESVKRRTRAHVILVATPAFTKDGNWYRGRTKRIGEFLEVVRQLGREYGLATVDLYNPSLAFAAKHGNETFATDGIHPTAKGHKMMARTFLKQFNFYGLEEIVEANPAAGKVASTDGCDATLTATPGGSFTLKLVNRYDFPRKIGLTPAPAGRYDVYDENAAKLPMKSDSVVVELPCSVSVLPGGDSGVRREVTSGRTRELRLVPAGSPVPAKLPDRPEPTFRTVRSCADQLTDLRVNFPKARTRRPGGRCRDMFGLSRGGDAAARPVERIEVLFINHDAVSIDGEIAVASLPAKGWKSKPVTPVKFGGLKPGERFICEFELTGEPVCTYEGEMVVRADFALDGIPGPRSKTVTLRLFSPWTGIGTFCDSAEREKSSLKEKFSVVYPPEKQVDPAASYTRFDGKPLTWKPFRSMWCYPGMQRGSEVHWRNTMVGSKETVFAPWQPPGVIYAAKWVHCPDDRDVKLLPVFSSRVAKLWVNDTLVVDRINPDEKEWHASKYGMNWAGWKKTDYFKTKTVDAKLKKGWNRILFKLASNSRPWNAPDVLDLRIFDGTERPCPDLLGACVGPE